MRRIMLACLCLAALTSCVSVESRLAIRDDGAGTLTLAYRIPRAVADIGRSSGARATVLLPVEKADFERGLAGIPGVRLARYRRRVTEADVSVTAEIAFERVEDLAAVPSLVDAGFSLVESGGRRTLTQVVAGAPDLPPTPEGVAMADSLLAGGTCTVVVETPSPMTAGSVGVLSADRRTLTWTSTARELARRTASVVMTATW